MEKKASIGNITKDKADKEEVISIINYIRMLVILNFYFINLQFKQIPMGIKWEWDETKKGLTYKT